MLQRLSLTVSLLAALAPAAEPKLSLRDGDRVALVGATLIERDRHYGCFEMALRNRFPGVAFSVRNMAWPGDTTTVQLRPLNFGTFEEHVKRFAPTVAIVSYGVNESFSGREEMEAYLDGYRRLLDILKNAGAEQIVLVTPNRHEKLPAPYPDPESHNKHLRAYADATLKLAKERGLPAVDLFRRLPSTLSIAVTLPLTENGIHLSPPGYAIAADTLAVDLRLPSKPWTPVLDAAGAAAEIPGLSIEKLTPTGVAFTGTEPAVPVIAPENDIAGAPKYLARRALTVKGLAPGYYVLSEDGEDVLSASASDWAAGVSLDDDLACDQARQLQREIVKKDLLFFNRHRAHNGEYIYGRRSQPGGGNAGNPTFPAEMAEFDRLLAESDQRIVELSRPATRKYALRPE